MKTEDLKTGFWGYKKYSVYQYITEMETQFSAKLLEKDEEAKALLEQEQQHSRQLEEELDKLHKQLDRQQEEQALIASTLMEAKRYAQQLKDQAEEQQKAAQQQLEEALSSRDAELKLYESRLQELRQQFKDMLQEMDGSTQQLLEEAENIKAQAPERNMSLFRRKPELVV